MSCGLEATCATCGRFIDHKDLYEDFDKLGDRWTFHQDCFNKFNSKEYKKK